MKYYSLIDKVYSEKNLLKAYHRVNSNRGAPGIDGVTVKSFGEKLLEEIERLSEEIKSGEYMPMPLRRVEIPKADGKTRQLGIPAVRDRVVQQSLKEILEPIFEVSTSIGNVKKHRSEMWKNINDFCEINDQAN